MIIPEITKYYFQTKLPQDAYQNVSFDWDSDTGSDDIASERATSWLAVWLQMSYFFRGDPEIFKQISWKNVSYFGGIPKYQAYFPEIT